MKYACLCIEHSTFHSVFVQGYPLASSWPAPAVFAFEIVLHFLWSKQQHNRAVTPFICHYYNDYCPLSLYRQLKYFEIIPIFDKLTAMKIEWDP